MDYTCGTLTGTTDSTGKFTYDTTKCTSVEFKLGSLSLGSISIDSLNPDTYLTVQELAGTTRDNVTDENVTKIAVLLQSLDDNNNTNDGITITQNHKNLFATAQNISDLNDTQIAAFITTANKTKKDKYEAINHLLQYTKSKDSSITTPALFQSGDTWKGLTYNTITSPTTGKVWLDRNLGATGACTDANDTACFGDYYQWGRETDGHEKSNSTTTTTQASTISNAGNQLINSGKGASEWVDGDIYDWIASGVDDNGSLRSANWSKTDGSSVCPVGYRVPTIEELVIEDMNSTDSAFSKLKIPSAGGRSSTNGTLGEIGITASIWSTSPTGTLYTYLLTPLLSPASRTYASPVRCVRGGM